MSKFDDILKKKNGDIEDKTMEDFFKSDSDYLNDIDNFYKKKMAVDAGLSAVSMAQNLGTAAPETPSPAYIEAPEFTFNRDDMMRGINERMGGAYSGARDIAMRYGTPNLGIQAVGGIISGQENAVDKLNRMETDVINKQAAATTQANNKNSINQEMNSWKRGQLIAQDNRMRSQLASSGLSNITNSLFSNQAAMMEQDNKANYFQWLAQMSNKGYDQAQLKNLLATYLPGLYDDTTTTTTE